MFCLNKGSRDFKLLPSLALISGTMSSTVAGNLDNFCANSEDQMIAGGDFDGDGLSDLACR